MKRVAAARASQDGATAQSSDGAPSTQVPIWSLYSTKQRWSYLTLLFLVATCNYQDYFVLSVLIEPIKSEFRASDTQMGLLSGACFALIYAAASVPLARWADRGNRRSVMTVALLGWSMMTVLCGLAQSFWHLALARFGVGAAEPGALPSAQSLAADYFPPERRATALAILSNGGSAVGWLIGIGLGGYIAARYGWRVAFVVAGLPGLLLALLVRLVLPEPRLRKDFAATANLGETTLQTITALRRKKTFVRALAAISIYAIFAYGVMVFIPSFMVRSLQVIMADVSFAWGAAIAIANLAGAALGGWLADTLSRRDIRWYAWLPALGCFIGMPLYWAALSCTSLSTFVAIEFAAELVISIGVSVSFATVLAVSGSSRRAFASASIFCFIALIGATLGPFLAGGLSDAFSASQGQESLRYALMAVVLSLLPAGVAFVWAGYSIASELEE